MVCCSHFKSMRINDAIVVDVVKKIVVRSHLAVRRPGAEVAGNMKHPLTIARPTILVSWRSRLETYVTEPANAIHGKSVTKMV